MSHPIFERPEPAFLLPESYYYLHKFKLVSSVESQASYDKPGLELKAKSTILLVIDLVSRILFVKIALKFPPGLLD